MGIKITGRTFHWVKMNLGNEILVLLHKNSGTYCEMYTDGMSSVTSDDGETFVHVQPLPVKSRKKKKGNKGRRGIESVV